VKSALVLVHKPSLRSGLQASLADAGYAAENVDAETALSEALRAAPRDALVAEARRDCFAHLLRSALQVNPQMPIHFIDAGAVFCFHPMRSQPAALIDALLSAGVRISNDLLRHTHCIGARERSAESFLV
jgi:hypothetical protein